MEETTTTSATSTNPSHGSQYLIPGSIVFAGLLIAGALYLGQVHPVTPSLDEQDSAQAGDNLAASAEQVRPVGNDDHIVGNPDTADLVLIEYSDFQCPFCDRFHPTVEQLVEEYDGRIAWVYRHFPLTSLHPQALPAALASECVAALGGEDAFWKFSDQLFANQERLGNDLYLQLAGQLGIDAGGMQACLDEDRYEERVKADAENAVASGGRGTPYTIVVSKNGAIAPFSGAIPYPQVKALVEQLLAAE